MSTVPAAGSVPPSSAIWRRRRWAIGTPRVWMPTRARRSSSALPSTISCAIRLNVRAIASESSRILSAEVSAGWRKLSPSRPHGTGLKDEARGTLTATPDGRESGAALGCEQRPERRERTQRQNGEQPEADRPRRRVHERGEGERRDDAAEPERGLLEAEGCAAPLASGQLGRGGERKTVPTYGECPRGHERGDEQRVGRLCQQGGRRRRDREAEAQPPQGPQPASDP